MIRESWVYLLLEGPKL